MQKPKLRTAIGIVVLILLFVLAYIAISFKKFAETPIVPADKPLSYILKPGGTVITLTNDLAALNLIDRPEFFIALAYWMGVTKNLKAGEYLFSPGTTPVQLLASMAAGNTHYQKFTLVEGWTFQQVLTAMNSDEHIKHTLLNATPIQVAQKLGMPPGNPEGRLFPATYYFTIGSTDISLLQRAYQSMNKQLENAWKNRKSDLPYKSSYEALIAASLIEKETRQPSERPLIAGVIVNRLNIGMPLQIDSSIIYGLGQSYTGKLTSANMKQNTLYNTYLRKGLPPTPIAMPGALSIYAAVNPDTTRALFFVSKGDGEHQFSETYAAHHQAVEIYQLKVIKPKIGTRDNTFNCNNLWYLSNILRATFPSRCVLR